MGVEVEVLHPVASQGLPPGLVKGDQWGNSESNPRAHLTDFCLKLS